MIRIAALLLFALAVTACSVRDVKYSPSHFLVTGVLAPPDVRLPRGIKSGDVVRGLHVLDASAPTEELCCWIDTDASLTVTKAAGQRTLHIGAYIPEVEQFKARPQRLKVRFANGHAIELPPMNPGMNAKVIAVPAEVARQEGPLELRLSAASPYFPGGHTSRPYGVLLLSIYFQ